MSQGLEWFDSLGSEEQSDVLLFLRHHCVQVCAVAKDGPESIRRAGLRPTHTPAVLTKRDRGWSTSSPGRRWGRYVRGGRRRPDHQAASGGRTEAEAHGHRDHSGTAW
ncbi:DUF5958 family protein [Streptomyces sp. ISL-36]|uniref:DUF5958 family protein n=1 Tax=Streptomyces sp. ISL-36 TaxID=2819182 RepID=UPI0020359005